MAHGRLAAVATADSERRVWRLRRQGAQIDALLRPVTGGWAVRLVLDGDVMLDRHFSTREDALSFATARSRELHLAGWYGHW
jgi:hypothetical protein